MSDVKIVNGALEESKDGSIVLRGSLSMDSLKALKVDSYQREVLEPSSGRRNKIVKGIEEGARLPMIELGMRGQRFHSKGNTFVLNDPVYIVDGLQRVSAMLQYLDKHSDNPNGAIPIAAEVHFNTSWESEDQRFAILNGNLRTPVSPNIILRNMREKHPALLTLYGLSIRDKDFPLYGRVTWSQRMKKGELISATSLVKAALNLHNTIVQRTKESAGTKAGMSGATIRKTLAVAVLDRVARHIGLQNFRENIQDFFQLIDDCYGIRQIVYTASQAHLRSNFLTVLALFIANNPQLWKDEDQRSLSINKEVRDKLKTFPIGDPEIRRLAAAGTMVIPTLYDHLRTHMNKRKLKENRYK